LSNQRHSSTINPRVTVDLIDIEQELFELPQKCVYDTSRTDCCDPNVVRQQRVLYNEEVQTCDVGEENDAVAAQTEAEPCERILREQPAEAESAAARKKELDEERVMLKTLGAEEVLPNRYIESLLRVFKQFTHTLPSG